MSIRIEIIDPTIKDEKMLVATARFLMEIAGHQMVPAPKEIENEHDKKLAEERLGLVKKHIEEVENKSERTIETLTKLDAEVKEKVKRKKTASDIGKQMIQEIVKQQEDIMMGVVKEIEKPPVKGGYEHCAAPIPPVSLMNFNTFMTKVTALRREEKIQEIDLLNIVRKHGIDKTHMLSTNPDLVPLVNADLDKFLEGK